VWAVGYHGEALHYDGSAWSLPPSGTTEYLWSVWASAPDNAWVVGTQATILHWDGHKWSR
jgi:hypothetical protein